MSENTLKDKLSFFQKLKNIKHIELILVGVFVLVLGVIFLSSTSSNKTTAELSNSNSLEDYASYLETKLTSVLKRIENAGNVSVMLTFDGRIKYEYATESEEVTTSSSVASGTNTKTVVNEKVIIVTQNGKSTPLIVREIYPEIAGVVVVASGANSVAVRLNIISAVETLLGIENAKIQVLCGSVK